MTVALSFKNDPLARQAAEAILIREEESDLLMVHKSGEAINEEEKLTKEEKQAEERLTKIISDRNKEKARLRKEKASEKKTEAKRVKEEVKSHYINETK